MTKEKASDNDQLSQLESGIAHLEDEIQMTNDELSQLEAAIERVENNVAVAVETGNRRSAT